MVCLPAEKYLLRFVSKHEYKRNHLFNPNQLEKISVLKEHCAAIGGNDTPIFLTKIQLQVYCAVNKNDL
jgi:hypothetical protein